jgi:ribosomal protein L44E
MPTFRSYSGLQSRPKRKRQLDLAPTDPNEPISLRATCRNCGHKGTVAVPAKEYYAVGFRLRVKCAECGARAG